MIIPLVSSTVIYRSPVNREEAKEMLARQKAVARFLVRIVVRLDGPFERCDKSWSVLRKKSRINDDYPLVANILFSLLYNFSVTVSRIERISDNQFLSIGAGLIISFYAFNYCVAHAACLSVE